MPPSFTLRLLALLLPLSLGACADTLRRSEVKPSSQLLKDYDKTLTKAEQKAAISDLEAAQAKARGESSCRANRLDRRKTGREAELAAAAKRPAALPRGPFLWFK